MGCIPVEHSPIVSRLVPSHPLLDDLYRAHYSARPVSSPPVLSAPAYPTVSNSPVDRAPQHFSCELALRNGFWSDSQFENPSSQKAWSFIEVGQMSVDLPARNPSAVVPAPPWWTTAAILGKSQSWGAESITHTSSGTFEGDGLRSC